jgi:L-asparaginase
MSDSKKVRIAHLSGPTATIQNTPPLVTSNKARAKHGLPLLQDDTGVPLRYDALRAQRLAAPATVYVEQFSAHPLERDAAELYGPPDGFLGTDGVVRDTPVTDDDTPVYAIELSPEDGLYPLPYMATQLDGSAWEEDMATALGTEAQVRQTFFPDGSRSFEEIDRLGIEERGTASPVSSCARTSATGTSRPRSAASTSTGTSRRTSARSRRGPCSPRSRTTPRRSPPAGSTTA